MALISWSASQSVSQSQAEKLSIMAPICMDWVSGFPFIVRVEIFLFAISFILALGTALRSAGTLYPD
jgi:hypothetical protein